MSRTTVAAAGGLLGLAGAGALRRTTRADARRVAADPSAAELAPLPAGRVQAVRSADGTVLHAEVHGPADAPTVVLAHGWTCSTVFWTPVVRHLMGTHRVVTYDQRGHGRSQVPAAFGPDQLADDLAAVLEATLPAGERAVLVGHSMGAMGIVAWAGRHPDQVASRAAAALLTSTGVDDLVTESLVVRLPAGWHGARRAVGRALLTGPQPRIGPNALTTRAVRHVSLSRQATPAQVAFCERVVLSCPPAGRVGAGSSLTELDLRHALAHLTVPTSVVVGTADRLTPPVHAERLAADLPHLERLLELPGVGHMSPVEDAMTVSTEVRRLVAEHLARTPTSGRVPA